MKRLPTAPFFETSVKNYIYGQKVIDYALEVDRAAVEFDVDAMFIVPYTEIREVAARTERLIIIAPYMDPIRPGRGIADVLPESLKEAGAHGVLLNHCERPMSLKQIAATIKRANELDLFTFVCADSVAETKAVAMLGPDIINPEPSELIGTDQASDMGYVRETLAMVRQLSPDILVEQAAGITTSQQIYDFIMAGNDGAGSASGILKSPDPYALMREMMQAVSRAKAERRRAAVSARV